MDTERLKLGKPAQAKGGKDSTKIVLTAAGAVAAGTAAAVAANEWINDAPEEQPQTQVATEEDAQQTTTEQTSQQEGQQGAGNNNGQPNQQTDTEIQPVDNNQTVEQTSNATPQNNETGQTHPNEDDPAYDSVDDVDPDLVALEIIGEEIDPNDVDVADMVIIDNVDTIYMEDGTEVPVAVVHDENNDQYLMVDIDDDMTFDTILDMEGNPIASVDGNLTMSDVLDMFDESGEELAYNAEQIEQELAGSEDPGQDIIDTNDLAMLDREDAEGMASITAIPEEEFEEGVDDSESDDDTELAETDSDEGDMIDGFDA